MHKQPKSNFTLLTEHFKLQQLKFADQILHDMAESAAAEQQQNDTQPQQEERVTGSNASNTIWSKHHYFPHHHPDQVLRRGPKLRF